MLKPRKERLKPLPQKLAKLAKKRNLLTAITSSSLSMAGLARPSAAVYGGNIHSAPEGCEIKFMDRYDTDGALIIGLRLALCPEK
jgi:hypothetical protein